MRDKWVDTHGYFGPDRRSRPGPERWKDRRTLDETGKPPPLGALLRRLRVQMMGVSEKAGRARTLQLLNAAIAEAERQRYPHCADALKMADRLLRVGTPAEIAQADSLIVDAAAHAAAAR